MNSAQTMPGPGLIVDGQTKTDIHVVGSHHIIRGGHQSGSHLLHSFQAFNIELGQSVDFQATPSTTHIINRVTDGHPSWINGTIMATNTNADLFLINPQGIMFGPGAYLDIQGAFHASTADYLTYGDGSRLYVDPSQQINLTVAAPESFGFLDASVGKIQIDGAHLSVPTGEQISLIGGEISLEAQTQLQAPAGRIVLVGVADQGIVTLRAEEPSDISQVAQHADIQLTGSTLYVSNAADSAKTGRIAIQGEQVMIAGGYIGLDNQSAVDATGISLGIEATNLHITDNAYITTTARGAGQGGRIQLQVVDTLQMDKDADLSATTDGVGAGGAVFLQAGQIVSMQDADISVLTRDTQAQAGRGGDVHINAAEIRFTDGAQIWARTEGAGKGGSVRLEARGTVHIQGPGDVLEGPSGMTVSTNSIQDTAGDGGTLVIQAENIIFQDGAGILAETYGAGRGGSVRLQAERQVLFSGQDPTGRYTTGIVVNTNGIGEDAGAGGDLTIQAADIIFDGDAGIKASSTGTAPGGSVRLHASDTVILRGTQIAGNTLHGITVSTERTAGNAGAGGSIQITATDITLERGTQLLAATAGTGAAGLILLQAQRNLIIRGAAELNSATQGSGDAGRTHLEAQQIQISGGATVTSASYAQQAGAGRAGNLIVLADQAVILSQGSALTTTARNAGGGTVSIQTQGHCRLHASHISTSVQGGAAQGGNIVINPVFIVLESSQLQANAYGGPGGNIRLQSDYLLQSGPVIIEASSALAAPGKVHIAAISIDNASWVQPERVALLDKAGWRPVSCDEQQAKNSRLRLQGYDAHPTPVDDMLSALPVWVHQAVE